MTSIEIVDQILESLKSNDSPRIQILVDNLQQLLSKRIMSGDLSSPVLAHKALVEGLAKTRGMGTDALRGLVARVSISNGVAHNIISEHECPLLNEAVCKNLMHHKPEVVRDERTSSFYLAKYWLASGDVKIFEQFATFLINQNESDWLLQAEILEALFDPMRRGDDDYADIYANWVAKNQDRILALSDGCPDNFGAHALHRGVDLGRKHLTQFGALIAQHTKMSPHGGSLYEARAELGVKWSDERLQREWANAPETRGWDEIGSIQAMIIYHLAFDDAPEPLAFGGQPLDYPHGLVNALHFLEEKGISFDSERLGKLVNAIIANADPYDRREMLETLSESCFADQLRASERYRDHDFSTDLGL